MKIKNKLIAALSVVAIACTAMAFGISNAYADETVTPNVYEETVCAVKGASVRYVDETHGAGVKFHVAMEKTAFKALGETAVTGVAVCPKGLLGNDTLATSESEQVKKVNAELTGWFESEAYAGAMELIVYVYDIPAANYGTDLAVAAYVTEGETTTWTVQKTFALAEVALTASETETDETLKEQLAGYYTFDYKAYGLDGTTAVKEEKVVYGAKLTAPEADDEVCYYANKAKTAEWNFEDGTVKGNVNLYAVAHNYVLKKSATEYWQECEHCGKKIEESVTAYLSGKAYVNGTELTADEAGNYVVGGDKNNQLTFDSAETMRNQGYTKLRVTAKFGKFENLLNAIGYNFTFGYKYKTTSVWVDMNYNNGGKMYASAVYGSETAPYSYGYIKIYDLSGNVVYDYYKKTITDAAGTHGSWSDYYDKLNENTEYVFEFDCAQTSDITILGWQDVTITSVVWGDSKTQVSFENESLTVDEWSEFTLAATTNDGSDITYTSSNDVVYVSGNKAMGVKEGTSVITAESNGKKAILTVTVNANAANKPVLTVTDKTQLEVGNDMGIGAVLTDAKGNVSEANYTFAAVSSDEAKARVEGKQIVGVAAGSAKITVTVTYYGVEFTQEINLTVVDGGEVDPSVGKVYVNGNKREADENGAYVIGGASGDKLTFDSYADKKAAGFTKLRIKVKFSAFSKDDSNTNFSGTYNNNPCEFIWTNGSVQSGWWNSYGGQAYVGAFDPNKDGPYTVTYIKVYNTDESLLFSHYNVSGWSSTAGANKTGVDGDGFGYIPSLATNTEYIFEFDISKTGDLTIWGFNNATITGITWVA